MNVQSQVCVNTQPVVWVVQDQHRYDESRGGYVPKFDMRPAESFGRIEYLLPPSAVPFRSIEVINELKRQLGNGWNDGDYLLLTGNPVLIGLAFAIAADIAGGSINVLQWSGKTRSYTVIRLNAIFLDE